MHTPCGNYRSNGAHYSVVPELLKHFLFYRKYIQAEPKNMKELLILCVRHEKIFQFLQDL